MSKFPFALPFLLLMATTPLRGNDQAAPTAEKIAGQTIEQYAAQLDEENRAVRLRAARSLGAFGVAAGDKLIQLLDHEDPAVRYIAAESLGRIGGEPLKQAKSRLSELTEDESSLAVRLAASYALCRAGLVEQHLRLLIETLQYPERGMVCSTAELIGNIGPSASAAIEPLEAVHQTHRAGVKGGDYHIGGAAMNALRKIRPPQD